MLGKICRVIAHDMPQREKSSRGKSYKQERQGILTWRTSLGLIGALEHEVEDVVGALAGGRIRTLFDVIACSVKFAA